MYKIYIKYAYLHLATTQGTLIVNVACPRFFGELILELLQVLLEIWIIDGLFLAIAWLLHLSHLLRAWSSGRVTLGNVRFLRCARDFLRIHNNFVGTSNNESFWHDNLFPAEITRAGNSFDTLIKEIYILYAYFIHILCTITYRSLVVVVRTICLLDAVLIGISQFLERIVVATRNVFDCYIETISRIAAALASISQHVAFRSKQQSFQIFKSIQNLSRFSHKI